MIEVKDLRKSFDGVEVFQVDDQGRVAKIWAL